MSQLQQVTEKISTVYKQQLYPWHIIQHLPKMQNRTIARFRRRNDADAHLRVLQQFASSKQYIIAFNPPLDKTNTANKERLSRENLS